MISIFNELIGNLNEQGTVIVIKTIHTLLEIYPKQSPIMLEGILVKIFNLMFSPSEPEPCVHQYIILSSQLIIGNLEYFLSFSQHLSNLLSFNILDKFLDLLFQMVKLSSSLF